MVRWERIVQRDYLFYPTVCEEMDAMKTKLSTAISGMVMIVSLVGCGVLGGGANSSFTPIPPGDGGAFPPSEATVEAIEPTPPLTGDGSLPCVAGDGEAVYTKPDEGYCVAYPAAFTVDEQESGVTVIHGPDYATGPEPLVGFVNISSQPAMDRTPSQVSDDLVADFLNTDILPERTDTMLGSERAVEIIGMPGQAVSWQVVAVHGETLYWLVFSPLGEENGDAFTDMQTLYDVTMRTFRFTD